MATRAEILASLLVELNRFDEQLGFLVRANRQHIAATGALITDSFDQFASVGSPGQRRNGTFLPSRAPSRRR
jgi:hypothetical protein